jgi:hypothetical protein
MQIKDVGKDMDHLEMNLELINIQNLNYVHELKIIHLLYHLFQLSIMLNHFYMQLIKQVYQHVLMNAIHVHWIENVPILLVLIDLYSLDGMILRKPNLTQKKIFLFFFS